MIPGLRLLRLERTLAEGLPGLPISPVLSAFQIPGADEPQDPSGSEDAKGNLESPKQGSGKMKLKSRLSGKWDSPPDAIFLNIRLQPREWEYKTISRMASFFLLKPQNCFSYR